MRARRAKGIAIRGEDVQGCEAARPQVDEAKIALGERGEPWWTDGGPDWNRQMAKDTPYAERFQSLAGG
jgi:hypothetical protein